MYTSVYEDCNLVQWASMDLFSVPNLISAVKYFQEYGMLQSGEEPY